MKKKLFNKGFTLLETLAAITLLGVICAILAPIMFFTTKDYKSKSLWHKANSSISSTLNQIKIENLGSIPVAIGNPLTDADFLLFDALSPYLSITEDCGNYAATQSCFITLADSDYTNALGNPLTASGTTFNRAFGHGQAKLSGNMFIMMGDGGGNPVIWIDVDGNNSGKNKLGEDLFGIELVYNSTTKGYDFYPMGSPQTQVNSTTYCTSNVSAYGLDCAGCGCSALYIEE